MGARQSDLPWEDEIAVTRMDPRYIEPAIESLVNTRYPYEVSTILRSIENPDDLDIVVAAALARSVAKGRQQGIEDARADIRGRLGL